MNAWLIDSLTYLPIQSLTLTDGPTTHSSTHAPNRPLHVPALFTILPRVLFGRAGAIVTIPGNIRANSIVVFAGARVIGAAGIAPTSEVVVVVRRS